MTGISYQLEITSDLETFFESALSKLEDFGPFHKNVGEHMLGSVDERFETETAPDGSGWTGHAPATVANRLRRHGNAPLTILREGGDLAGSFNYEADSSRVRIGSPIVYAAIHHFGGRAGRNHAVTIPARPVLGMSPEDEVAIAEMAEDYLRY